MALALTKTLRAFSCHDGSDTVSILARTVVTDGAAVVAQTDAEIYGSDKALQAAAVAAGYTTWDENTVCAVYGLVRAS